MDTRINGIKVIFFDMGNTLLHFHFGMTDDQKDLLGVGYLTEYLQKYDKRIAYEDVRKGFFIPWMEGIAERRIHNVEYPIEGFLNRFLNKYDVNLSIDQCIEAMKLFYTEYRNQVLTEENLFVTLKALKDKGMKLGVISNTCYYEEVMGECFKKAGIHEWIDEYTFSYSLRVAKPNPGIFEAAIHKMSMSPKEALMVGDSITSDVEPAIKLGMKAAWLNREGKGQGKSVRCDLEIASVSELLNYL